MPSLVPRSSQIWGGESLVTFTRKAVDFRCMIIHVINIEHPHCSNEVPTART